MFSLCQVFKQDVVVDAIERLGVAIARLVGLARTDQPEEVLKGVQEAKGALPLAQGMLDHSQPGALFQVLEKGRMESLIQLLQLEADALNKLNRPARAALRQKRENDLQRFLDNAK